MVLLFRSAIARLAKFLLTPNELAHGEVVLEPSIWGRRAASKFHEENLAASSGKANIACYF
ncbi:MAG: hypothetical protein IT425_06045 [Pirellulales bacterium]|nr:hypothetical protein [Pirellulales bacterium]